VNSPINKLLVASFPKPHCVINRYTPRKIQLQNQDINWWPIKITDIIYIMAVFQTQLTTEVRVKDCSCAEPRKHVKKAN